MTEAAVFLAALKAVNGGNQYRTMTSVFDGYLNPLTSFALDQQITEDREAEPALEDILEFFCAPDPNGAARHFVERYREISRETKERLFVVPNEQRIMEKLIWPLHHAQAGYMVGNYLGSIALCGMVTEMLVVLLFEMSGVFLRGKRIGDTEARKLFGREFEKLGQERRVQILRVLQLIDKELESRFDLVRTTRRKYLHLYSQAHDELPNDALKVYDATEFLVARVIAPKRVEDGKVVLREQLMSYLVKIGVAVKDEAEIEDNT